MDVTGPFWAALQESEVQRVASSLERRWWRHCWGLVLECTTPLGADARRQTRGLFLGGFFFGETVVELPVSGIFYQMVRLSTATPTRDR